MTAYESDFTSCNLFDLFALPLQSSDEELPLRGAGLLGRSQWRAGHLPRLHLNIPSALQGRHQGHQGVRLQSRAAPSLSGCVRAPSSSADSLNAPPLLCPSQTSEYPVILSLENHCSVEQQKLMAHHLITILGDALLSRPLGDTMPTNFPSPEVGRSAAKGQRLTLNISYTFIPQRGRSKRMQMTWRQSGFKI